MDPIDREVLALRHFEQLSNAEIAQVLGIDESTAEQPLPAGPASDSRTRWASSPAC